VRQSTLLVALALFALAQPPARASDGIEVRFHPEREMHLLEAEARRGVSTLVLQNAAIVRRGSSPVELLRGAFELWTGDQLVQSTPLSSATLDGFTVRSGQLAASGMIDLLAFQFAPESLLADARVVGSRILGDGEALLVGSRTFLVQGAPIDRFRIRVEAVGPGGETIEAVGELPVRFGGSTNRFAFPLVGAWWVPAAPSLHSHHRWAVPEEFALDSVKLADGASTHGGDGSRMVDYAAWDAEVRAAADGQVVAVLDRFPDAEDLLRRREESDDAYFQRILQQQSALLTQGEEAIVGNYVVLEHASGEFSHYAHLKAGSVAVQAGETVRRGQSLGRLGSSGNSTEPHLHFQVTDGPHPLRSAAIPIRFEGIRIVGADWERQIQSGDLIVAE